MFFLLQHYSAVENIQQVKNGQRNYYIPLYRKFTQGAEDYLKSQENAEVIMLNVKSRLQNITSTITIAMQYIYIYLVKKD